MLSAADLTPPEDRDELDAWLLGVEERVARQAAAAMRAIVAERVERYLQALTAGPADAFDGAQDEWERFVRNELGESVGALHRSGSLSAFMWAPGHVPASFADRWAQVVNDAAGDYQRAATNRIVGAGPDVWARVRSITAAAAEAGLDPEGVKAAVEKATGYSEFRADTIARTETVGAYNGGEYAGAQALGEHGPVEKQWLAANDARTRPSHLEADGQVVPFAQPFNVGGVQMDRPHAPGAPASEVVNCRCVLLLLYPGDTRPDGSVVEGPAAAEPESWQPPDVEALGAGGPLTEKAAQPELGGAHAKTVLVDANGNEFLFKPMEDWVAHGEAAAAEVALRAGLDVPRVTVFTHKGRTGSLQPMLAGSRKPFGGVSPHAFDPMQVSADDLRVIQQHRVLDWAIGNHDAHADQFVRIGYASHGDSRLVGIDKGQAFKHFGEDRLDYQYHPNGKFGEARPAANIVEEAYANNQLPDGVFLRADAKSKAVHKTAQAIQDIPDDEYRALLRSYAKGRWPGDPDAAERFLDAAVARKNTLVDDLSKYHIKLYDRRYRARKKAMSNVNRRVAGPGGPKGMAGAAKSEAHLTFMRKHDHPITDHAANREIVTYTGGDYRRINGDLRAGRRPPELPGMRKSLGVVKEDMEVYRGVTLQGGRHVPDGDIRNVQGAVFTDRGFLSTSAGHDRGPAFGGDVAFRIRVNAGDRGGWVQEVSLHRGEREFILPDGLSLYVHVVRRPDTSIGRWEGNFRWIVECEVVSDEWVAKQGLRVWDSNRGTWA